MDAQNALKKPIEAHEPMFNPILSTSSEGTGSIHGQKTSDYFSIPLKVLRVDTIPGFNLYLYDNGKGSHALYKSGSAKFKEEYGKKLEKNKISELFVKSSDKRFYSQYLEENLTDIISDRSIPLEKKSNIIYNCSTELLHNIFTRTRIAELIPRASKVVTNIIEHLSKGTCSFISMLDEMAHDYDTINHSVNVCIIGLALGGRIGLKNYELNELGAGLFLHDLGKSKIDEGILRKQGPLNEEEWRIIKMHPKHGAALAERTNRMLPLSLTVIKQHHEKCNGKGYPMGLYEQQIHLYGHIAAIADVYDALTTERPYGSALDAFPAIQLMRREMENDFSGDLFKELVLLLNDRPQSTPQKPSEKDGR